ncbi:lysylphosphatidylglycerol synthase transmembrane domain-containing protein [Methanocella sp. MCL-LM]|uniref:lysylphosphatidylglycerol synthase transmembrane domain-containing protein n=1 Tax=Methanocella sp. MCL-LM TaxID=3412035 RepID=UPI003C70D362
MISEADVKFPDIPFNKTAILIVVGLVIYFVYLYLVGFDSLVSLLKSVSLPLMGLALLVSLCGNLFHAAGWWVLLRDTGHKISLGWSYLIYLSSIFFTNLIPSAAASGEVAKLYFIQKSVEGGRFDKTFAAGVMSRLLEVVPVALGTIIGVTFVAMYFEVPAWVLAFCIFVAVTVSIAALVILAVSMNTWLLTTIANSLVRVVTRIFKRGDQAALEEKVGRLVAQFDGSMRSIAGRKLTIVKSLGLIIIAWGFDVAVAYIAFRAIGYDVSPGVVITIFCIMVLLQLVPTFLPGGLGIVDAVMTVLYLSMGVPQLSAAGATIMIRLVTLWFLTAVGGLTTLYLARVTGTGASPEQRPA